MLSFDALLVYDERRKKKCVQSLKKKYLLLSQIFCKLISSLKNLPVKKSLYMNALKIDSLPETRDLLKKISKGDERAFRIVFDAYQKKIYSSAYQMLRDATLAEEVVQETMLKLWMMGESLIKIENLQAYLFKVSRNKAFDLLREKEMKFKVEKNMRSDWKEGHNETEEQILLNETRKILADGINLLPPQQKVVYQLCHQKGLKYEEAALKLNLSIETIRSYMRLAQRFLRNYVRSHSDVMALLIIFKLL